jgi:hypothetical protein
MVNVSGGCEMVSVATDGTTLVASCAQGWTQEDWDLAFVNAGLSGIEVYVGDMDTEADGTEIYYFTIADAVEDAA